MNLIQYVNEEFEEQEALYDLESGRVIMEGDWYHDKIDYKIEGYLEALKEYKIYTQNVPRTYISQNHEDFKKVGFYPYE